MSVALVPSPGFAEEVDVIETDDGSEYYGEILRELDNGFLFRTLDGQTITIDFASIVDVRVLTDAEERVERQGTVAPDQNGLEAQQYRLRRPGIAFGLSLLLPGSGQFYYRDALSGTLWLVGGLGSSATLIALASTGHELTWVAAAVDGTIAIASSVHAALGATRYNDRLLLPPQPAGPRRDVGRGSRSSGPSTPAAFGLSVLWPGLGHLYLRSRETDRDIRRARLRCPMGRAHSEEFQVEYFGSGRWEEATLRCSYGSTPYTVAVLVALPTIAVVSGIHAAVVASPGRDNAETVSPVVGSRRLRLDGIFLAPLHGGRGTVPGLVASWTRR